MPDRPNVVVVCCDDLGYGDLSCYGAEYDTPNVDSLADDGVRFTDWHSNAPVCSPSRASLLTGQYPAEVGVPGNAASARGPDREVETGLDPEATTVADAFSAAGYDTAAFGKWHLGMRTEDGPNANGFDRFFGFRSGCIDYYSHTFIWRQHDGQPPYHDLWADGEEVWRNGEYFTDMVTEEATGYVEQQAGDDPFFMYVAYNAPHYPMHAPPEYFERFDHLEGDRRVQAAMVATIDDSVGAILDELRSAGAYEDTVVVFTSDHGPSREVRNHLDGSEEPYTGGSTGGHRGQKFSVLEGGIRVPGIVSYPAELDQGESDAFAVSMDVFPTLCDIAGIECPVETAGSSLADTLGGGGSPHADERVFWTQGDQLAVRDGDWKLVLDGGGVGPDAATDVDPVHLSNLADDPGETTNLAEDRPELAEELSAAARAWGERVAGEP
jgi:arylsulfatase A-like enzyme